MRAMPRVPLAQFEPALGKRLEELWGAPPNLYRALANHPRLIAAWSDFSKALRHDTRTPRALRELVILRGAQLMRSEYEWAQHLKMARKAGVRHRAVVLEFHWRRQAGDGEPAAARRRHVRRRGAVLPDLLHLRRHPHRGLWLRA